MAVTEVRELYNRRASSNEQGHRTYSRVFVAWTDNPFDDGNIVAGFIRDYFGIVKGGYYLSDTSFDTGALLTDIEAVCTEEEGNEWEVTYTYKSDYEVLTSPLLEAPEVSWDAATFERPVDYDIFGRPILNSAGVPYADPVMRDDFRPVLRVTRNQAFYSTIISLYYGNCVNSDWFFGCPPGTVKASPPVAQLIFDPTWGYYYRVSYEFMLDPNGWHKTLLSQGLIEIGSSGHRLISKNGVPVTEPVMLGMNGQALPPGSAPVFGRYHIYNRAPLTQLIA